MKRRRPSIRFPRPLAVILVMFLPGPIITLLLWGAECAPKRLQSKDQRARDDVTTTRAALDSYALEHTGNYPDSLAVLVDLVMAAERGHRYLNQSRLPRDPWDRDYIYVRGESVNVLTYGRDGVPGGTGDDADIDYDSIVNTR